MKRVTHDLRQLGDLTDTEFGAYGDWVTLTFTQGAIRRTVLLPLGLLADTVTAVQQHADFMERRAKRFKAFAAGDR